MTDGELCAVIKAIRANLAQYLWWSISPGHLIRVEAEHSFPAHRRFMHVLAQSYAKAYMAAGDRPEIGQEFMETHTLSNAAWELIDLWDRAEDWDDIKVHRHKPWDCALCSEVSLIL